MLRRCCCLLFIVQLSLLCAVVSSYLHHLGLSPLSPHGARALEQESQRIGDRTPHIAPHKAADTTKSLRSKPTVKMKPIPLAYLREQLRHVTSPMDLMRLFSNSDASDRQLSDWMMRHGSQGHSYQLPVDTPHRHYDHDHEEVYASGDGDYDGHFESHYDGKEEEDLEEEEKREENSGKEEDYNMVPDKSGDDLVIEDYMDYPGDEPANADMEAVKPGVSRVRRTSQDPPLRAGTRPGDVMFIHEDHAPTPTRHIAGSVL